MKKTLLFAFLSMMTILVGLASCSGDDDVAVTGIKLDRTEITLLKGESCLLRAIISPENATNTTVTWSSSNPSVATVDGTGKVTAIEGGTTTVTVTTTDGKISATCAVVVTVSVQSVVLDKTEVSLVKGQTVTLIATISPSDATTKEMIWSTSDEHIVTVDNGNIKAVGVGTATISVTTKDGSKVATCTVTVDKSENIGYHPYGDGQQW